MRLPPVPPPSKPTPSKPQPPRPTRPAPTPTVAPPVAPPTGPTEIGWLPDFVYTGGKFEAGMAFFADPLGRIARFSREPADVAKARKLPGQAALPGLINTHSVAWHRVLRGRTDRRARPGSDPLAPWREAAAAAAGRLNESNLYDIARMSFTEMLLAGITCVGESHSLRDVSTVAAGESETAVRALMKAAHDVGIRLALFGGAALRSGYKQPIGSAQGGFSSAEAYLRATDALRLEIERNAAADEVWLGIGASLAAVPIDELKTIAAYAHAKRLRLQLRATDAVGDNETCTAEFGRSPVALLAQHGIVDKRLTVIHAVELSEAEIAALGAAKANVCACPSTELNFGFGLPDVAKLITAGAGIAIGSGAQEQIDLLRELRFLEYSLRGAQHQRPAIAVDAGAALLNAATVTGARSLGATGGALEVGRPADFFTVNIYDPSIVGADVDSLLANIVYGLERRAIREVWIGARQRLVNGRHPEQGLIVGRFVELQRRLWT
jgi:formimidoylglutamate deiminase